MPIQQKRLYEVTMSEKLQRLLAIENHTVTTLRELRDAYFEAGNEISNVLGSFVPQNPAMVIQAAVMVEEPKRGRGRPPSTGPKNHAVGTANQKNQIFSLLKEKGKLTSRKISEATGIPFATACAIMHYLSESKQVTKTQNPEVKYREYLFALPPSEIIVA